eukprot:TRINITY_DN1374_c0_g1_i1.p1 TRINITY_DN1374_c0_g1~~TRINITY_DN1374_c0_g1_i1.p1  ORF type:complete len:193 (-),score=49.15 TRINITY_DN1374_c0_g1_i1:806-1384(-)
MLRSCVITWALASGFLIPSCCLLSIRRVFFFSGSSPPTSYLFSPPLKLHLMFQECPVVEEEIGPLTKYFPQLYKLDLMCCNLSDRTLLELFNNATPPPPSSPPPSAPPPLLALPSSWTNTTNSQSRVINWCLPTINCFLQILNLVDTPLEDENLWKPAATRHMRAMEEYGLKFKLTLPNGTLFSPLDSIQQQ